jgi:hypothetical protein
MYCLKIYCPDNNPYHEPNRREKIGLSTREFRDTMEREFNAGHSMGWELIHLDNGRTFIDSSIEGEGNARRISWGKYNAGDGIDRSFARLEALAKKHGIELEVVPREVVPI